jgi:hypothetical protein
MTRGRQVLLPTVLVIVLVLGVCALSLAHAEPRPTHVCGASDTSTQWPALADFPVVPPEPGRLTQPSLPVWVRVSQPLAVRADDVFASLLVPRAPPVA